MRWRFWRRDAALFDAPLVAPVSTPPTSRRQPDDDSDAVVSPVESRAVPVVELPDLPNGPVAAPQRPADTSGAAEVVRLVRLLVARQPAAAQEPAAAPVAVTALALRLPPLAGVTGPVEHDPDARSLLLAYADLLAARADPLRRRCTPDLPRDLLSGVAREACGEPAAPAALGDRLVAACVLLAQTCADGADGPEAILRELERARPA